jgi:hypothetical protein
MMDLDASKKILGMKIVIENLENYTSVNEIIFKRFLVGAYDFFSS